MMNNNMMSNAEKAKFPHLPDIPIDTLVHVYIGMSSAANADFISAHFAGWTKQGRIATFDYGRTRCTSFRSDICQNWTYWIIAEGEHKGKKNFDLEDSVESVFSREGDALISIEARKIMNGE